MSSIVLPVKTFEVQLEVLAVFGSYVYTKRIRIIP